MPWPKLFGAKAPPAQFASRALRRMQHQQHRSQLQKMMSNRQLRYVRVENADILLFGTSHISKSDPADIRDLITKLKPHRICVELCYERLPGLLKRYGAESVKELKRFPDISEQKDEYGLSPYGADILAALQCAAKHQIQHVLIDRQQSVTAARLAAKEPISEVSTFWCLRPLRFARDVVVTCAVALPACIAGLTLLVSFCLPRFVWVIPGLWLLPVGAIEFLRWLLRRLSGTPKENLQKALEVIDRLEQERQACLSSKPDVKQAELDVDSVMNESVITSERDTYMACKLQGIARASPSNLVLVIVGMGHLDGIETKFSKGHCCKAEEST